jgi:hypothetical protein
VGGGVVVAPALTGGALHSMYSPLLDTGLSVPATRAVLNRHCRPKSTPNGKSSERSDSTIQSDRHSRCA